MNNLAILLKRKAYKAYVDIHSPITISKSKPVRKTVQQVDDDIFDPTFDGNIIEIDDEADVDVDVDAEPTEVVIIPKCNVIIEAISYYEHAISIRGDTLGPSHPDTITAIYNYVELLVCVGKHTKHYIVYKLLLLPTLH